MIYAKHYGRGSSVVFGLHGWSGDHRTFEPLVQWMPSQWKLVGLDLPGYGSSTKVNPLTVESIATSIAEYIERTQGERVRLIGSCSGGIIALAVASRIPEKIERVIALDLFAYVPWYFRVFLWDTIGTLAYRLTFATAIGRAIVNATLSRRRTTRSHLTASFERQNHAVVWGYLRALAQLPGPEMFSTLDVPVELVVGERSFTAVRRSIPLWMQALPHAQLHVIPTAGHLLLDDAPEYVAMIAFSSQ